LLYYVTEGKGITRTVNFTELKKKS
jgi:hypothetical protein